MEGDEESKLLSALELAIKHGLAASGDKVVLAHGVKSGVSSLTNFRMVVIK